MKGMEFKTELLDWIRYNKKHAKKTGDGLSNLSMGTPSLPPALGRVIVASFLNPGAQNKTDRPKIESSSHLVLFTTDNSTVEAWIQMGRTLERFLLKTTQLGIANSFMNQPCAIPSLAQEIRNKLLAKKEFPSLLLRIGYANPMPYSCRKEVESAIIPSKK